MRAGTEQPGAEVGLAAGCGAGWLWAAALAAALGLYVFTMSPDLVWQDAGEYQWNVGRFAWPWVDTEVWVRPGEAVRVHPWFLVVAHALWRPSLWNYAYAANLCAALSMSLAAANVVLLIRLMTGRVWPAVIGGVTFAVGHTIWAHACIPEVYGWEAAFLSAECLCAWAWIQRRRARWLLALYFLGGLAISNHMMASLGLAAISVWVFVECVRGRARWWIIPAVAGVWTVAATLFWVVVGLEYARTGSVLETLRSATVGGYGGAALNLAHLPRLLKDSVLYLGLNYPTPVALAGIVGAVVLVRRRETMATLLLAVAGLYLVWAARYDVPDQYGFFVPFYVPGGVIIGVGASAVLKGRRAWEPWAMLALALVPVAVYAVLPDVARDMGLRFFKHKLPYRDPYTYFLRPWQRGYMGARQFAEGVMAALPERAIILPDETAATPLKCVHDVEGRGSDVLVIDQFDAKFFPAYRVYWGDDRAVFARLKSEGRRVFLVSTEPGYAPLWVFGGGVRVEEFARTPEGDPLLYEVKPVGPEWPQ
jgi:hypothetical protein